MRAVTPIKPWASNLGMPWFVHMQLHRFEVIRHYWSLRISAARYRVVKRIYSTRKRPNSSNVQSSISSGTSLKKDVQILDKNKNAEQDLGLKIRDPPLAKSSEPWAVTILRLDKSLPQELATDCDIGTDRQKCQREKESFLPFLRERTIGQWTRSETLDGVVFPTLGYKSKAGNPIKGIKAFAWVLACVVPFFGFHAENLSPLHRFKMPLWTTYALGIRIFIKGLLSAGTCFAFKSWQWASSFPGSSLSVFIIRWLSTFQEGTQTHTESLTINI